MPPRIRISGPQAEIRKKPITSNHNRIFFLNMASPFLSRFSSFVIYETHFSAVMDSPLYEIFETFASQLISGAQSLTHR